MSENFNIRVSDQVDPSILNKLEAIALKAISAHTAIEKLEHSLSSVGKASLGNIGDSQARLAADINKASLAYLNEEIAINRAVIAETRALKVNEQLEQAKNRTLTTASLATAANERSTQAQIRTNIETMRAAQAYTQSATAQQRLLQAQANTESATVRTETAQRRLASATSIAAASQARAQTATLGTATAQQRLATALQTTENARVKGTIAATQAATAEARLAAATAQEAASKDRAVTASIKLQRERDKEIAGLIKLANLNKAETKLEPTRVQKTINTSVGVDRGPSKSARDSASAFKDAFAEEAKATRDAEKAAAQAIRERKEATREAQKILDDYNKTNREAEKAANSLARRTDALLNTIDPLRAAQQQHNKTVAEADNLLKRGAITQEQHRKVVEHATKTLDLNTASLNRNARGLGFTQNQLLTFQYTFNDVVASLASGGSASTIFFQQIGQVTQAFNDPEGSMKGFINRLGLVRLGLIGVGVAAASTVGIWLSAQSELSKFNNLAKLTGNSAGFTADSFEEMSRRVAAANNATISSSQELANKLIQTGQFGSQQIEQIVFSTQRLSKLHGQSTDEIIQNWIRAADSPGNYAEALAQLKVVNPTLVEHIKYLDSTGDKTKALELLARSAYDYLGGVVPGQLNGLARAFNVVTTSISNAYRTFKNFLNEVSGDRISSVNQLADAEARLAGLRQMDAKTPARSLGTKSEIAAQIALTEKEVAGLREADRATKERTRSEEEAGRKRREALEASNSADQWLGMIEGPKEVRRQIALLDKDIAKLKAGDPTNPKLQRLLENRAQIAASLEKRHNPPGPKPPKWQQPIEEKRSAFLAQQTAEINKQAAAFGQLRAEREVHQKLTEIDIALAAKAAQVQPKDRHKFGQLSEEEKQTIRLSIVRQQGNEIVNQHVDSIFAEAKAYALNYEAASNAIDILTKKNAVTGKAILSDREAGIAMRKRDYEYKQATDNLADFNRELEDNTRLMGMSADERYIEAPIIQRKRSLEPHGKELSAKEEQEMRTRLQAMQELERRTRALDAIEAATVGTKKELIAQQQALTEAQQRGYFTTETYKNAFVALQASITNFNLSQGIGTFEESVMSSLARMVEGFTNAKQGITDSFGQLFVSIQDGFAQSIGDAIFKSESLKDSLQQVAQTAGSQLVASLVKVGTQYLINEVLFDSWNKKETVGTATQAAIEIESIFATTMAKIMSGKMLVGAATADGIALAAIGASLAAAWAPAAAAVSLATQGANSIPATAGLITTYTTSKLMASPIPGFQEGGYTGDVGRSSVAGVVHGQEFVMNAAATARNRATLEAMNRGKESSRGEGWTVEVNNYGTPQTYEVESIDEGKVRLIARDEARGVVAREAPSVVASDMRNPNSTTSKSIRDTHNVTRRR